MALLNKKEDKKNTKAKVFSEMTTEDLNVAKKDLKESIMKERFKMVTGSISNVKHLSFLKKDYARVLTNLNKKRLS